MNLIYIFYGRFILKEIFEYLFEYLFKDDKKELSYRYTKYSEQFKTENIINIYLIFDRKFSFDCFCLFVCICIIY